MVENTSISKIKENIQKTMEQPKCRKCGCMKETLETMRNELLKTKDDSLKELLLEIEASVEKMEPIKYT